MNILLKMILGEICEDFTDEELDEVILEVRSHHFSQLSYLYKYT